MHSSAGNLRRASAGRDCGGGAGSLSLPFFNPPQQCPALRRKRPQAGFSTVSGQRLKAVLKVPQIVFNEVTCPAVKPGPEVCPVMRASENAAGEPALI